MQQFFEPVRMKINSPKNKHGPGPFGTEMDHSGPRRGLRPSLRWGQIGLHFGLEMLIYQGFFTFSIIFGAQKGPRPGGQPRPQKFYVNINKICVFIFFGLVQKMYHIKDMLG